MTNEIYQQVVDHLNSGDNKRVVFAVQGGYNAPVLNKNHIPLIKAEGNGLRFRKLFVFTSQVKFARVETKIS